MKSIDKLFTSISLISADGEELTVAMNKTIIPTPYFPGSKFKIDITDLIPKRFDLESIAFQFKNVQNQTLMMSVEDKDIFCNRPLASNKMLFSGDKIEVKMKENVFVYTYSLDLR